MLMKDVKGIEIKAGDRVVYAVGDRWSRHLHFGTVQAVTEEVCSILGDGNIKTGQVPPGKRIWVIPAQETPCN